MQALACNGIKFTLSQFTMLSKNPQFLYDHHEHLILNHSVNFIDQDTGAHMHGIERKWRKVPGEIRCYGKLKHHFIGNLADFIFIRLHPGYKERIHAIFTSIGQLHNGSELLKTDHTSVDSADSNNSENDFLGQFLSFQHFKYLYLLL